MAETCANCDGEGWVCENHRNMPWRDEPDKRGCDCGAGAPCHFCNPCDRDNPPRMPPGTTEIDLEDDGSIEDMQEKK